MHMHRLGRQFVCAALFVATPVSSQTAAPATPNTDSVARAWNLDAQSTPADPAIRFGVLPNGMKYAIRRNMTPKNSTVIRFRIDVGSTAEADDQRGLAHFLEHMAFNGSTNVREGEMVKLLERDGLAFGADTNASTSYTQTVYKLDLPRADDALVDTGLMLMREIASELTLLPAAIDRERGVILSEMRLRDQAGLRNLLHFLEFMAPGTPVARRKVIGTTDVLQTAPAARLRDLYDRFYTPGRSTLVMVGDFDPVAIEAKIVARFASWRPRGQFDGDPSAAKIDTSRTTGASYFVDPAVPTAITIAAVKPFVPQRDTPALRRQQIVEAIATGIVSRRLARLAQTPDAPILGGGASAADLFRTLRLTTIEAVAKDGDWRPALAMGEQELRRALQHGFTRAEIDEQLAGVRASLENETASVTTRTSTAHADTIAASLEMQMTVSTPEWRLAQLREVAPTITPDAVTTAFRARWAGVAPLVRIAAKTPLVDAPAKILQAFADSSKVEVTPPVTAIVAAFAYTDFGAPGKIVADTRITDLDLRTVRFANNVRLTVKKTDFEKDIVRISLRVGGGQLEFGRDGAALSGLMATVFTAGGLQKHSLDELRSILAGRSVTPGFGVGENSFGTKTATTPRDFELQIQLLAAYLTAPGFRPEADRFWQRAVPLIGPSLEASPAAIFQRDAGRIVADGDPRFGVPDAATLAAQTSEKLRAATARAFTSGSVEIGIVGDIEEAKVIEIVGKTFGALPPRDPSPLPFTDARKVRFAQKLTPATLRHAGKPGEAQTMRYWPTTDDSNAQTDVDLDLLSGVMRLMLNEELREKLGATYSATTDSDTSSIYPGYGFLSAGGNVDVARMGEVEAAIDRVATQLRDRPVPADLLTRARNPLLERLTKRLRENTTWLNVAEDAQSEPRFVARFRIERTLYEKVTPARLQEMARRYLMPGKALTIRAVAKTAP